MTIRSRLTDACSRADRGRCKPEIDPQPPDLSVEADVRDRVLSAKDSRT